MIGGTYKITPELTAYAGYSEANRAPTPLELGCADPARPCIIAAFLVADPPLKQVVSRTVEAGFRGTKELNIGTLGWKIGAFRATNADDILAIPEPGAAGIWLFPERRSDTPPGHRGPGQSEVEDAAALCQLCARRCALPRFACRSAPTARSPMPTAMSRSCRAIEFRRSPAIGSSSGSITSITDAFKVGGDALFVSSQYFVGDESNQAARLPSYTVFNLHTLLSDQQERSRSTAASTTSSTIATRPTVRSSIPTTCPISPMAARRSPTRVRSARRGRAPFTRA